MNFDEKLLNQLNGLGIEQLLIVAIGNSLPQDNVALYLLKTTRFWDAEVKNIPAVIGKRGATTSKIEGDNKTPFGLYKISLIFGTSPHGIVNMPFRQITANDKYVDDQEHPDYNNWVAGETTAKSYETMLREDGLYELGAVIDYNTNPVISGKGSAIFIHIWRGNNIGTEGCIAMDLMSLKLIFKKLDQSKNPHILIVPATGADMEYAQTD